jgi:hypothetical protein
MKMGKENNYKEGSYQQMCSNLHCPFSIKLNCRTQVLHDMEPGDAIVHTRYCFHRGEPFTPEAAAAGAPTRLAYSIRYESAAAKLFKGSEPTKKPISKTGAYYPQVPSTRNPNPRGTLDPNHWTVPPPPIPNP